MLRSTDIQLRRLRLSLPCLEIILQVAVHVETSLATDPKNLDRYHLMSNACGLRRIVKAVNQLRPELRDERNPANHPLLQFSFRIERLRECLRLLGELMVALDLRPRRAPAEPLQ